MKTDKLLGNEQEEPAKYILPRVITGLAGGALLFYGFRKRRGILGGLASTAGLSLIAKSINNPAVTETIKARTGSFNRARSA